MMKKLLVLLMVILNAYAAAAQNAPDRQKELTKANKGLMKQLKEKYGLKSIEVRMEEDGYWYYLIEGTDALTGIMNQLGEIIVPPKYGMIAYMPPLQEGMAVNAAGDSVWHRANAACFQAQTYPDRENARQFGIYRLDGTPMVDGLKAQFCFNSSEGYAEYTLGGTGNDEAMQILYTQDGECLMPSWCTFYRIEGKVCYLHKRVGKVLLQGAMMLDHSLPPVPCIYASVSLNEADKQWVVVAPMSEEDKVCFPKRKPMTDVQDKGMDLFWAEKYDDVLDHYAKRGIDQPWAKFFAGAALLEKVREMDSNVRLFLSISKSGKMDDMVKPGTTWRQYFAAMKFDFNLMSNLFTTGYKMLDAYVLADSTFAVEAQNYTLAGLDNQLRSLGEERARFMPLWQRFVRENEEVMASLQTERKRMAKRGEELGQMAAGFVHNLAAGLTRPSLVQRSTYAGVSARSFGMSADESSTPVRTVSSAAATAKVPPVEYRQCSHCHGTGDICTTTTEGTYGYDEMVTCNVCGQQHWRSSVHHHRKCEHCGGSGKVVK